MPRIQILNLPDELIDGELHNRFVLVLDEHPSGGGPKGKRLAKKFDRFARSIGAAGGLVSKDRVEIVGEEAGGDLSIEFDHAALLDTISAAVRAHLESTPEHHFQFTAPTLTHERLETAMGQADRRRRGNGGAVGRVG